MEIRNKEEIENIESFIETKSLSASSRVRKIKGEEVTISWPAIELRVLSIKAYLPDLPEMVAYGFDSYLKQHPASELYRDAGGKLEEATDQSKKCYYDAEIDAVVPNLDYVVGERQNNRIDKIVEQAKSMAALTAATEHPMTPEQFIRQSGYTKSDTTAALEKLNS